MNRIPGQTHLLLASDQRRSLEVRRQPVRTGAVLLAAAWLASCGALVGGGPTVGGETHFLLTCQEDCGPGLSCIEGVCTRGCTPGYSSCSELASTASCEAVPEASREQAGFAGTCDVGCREDADCRELGGAHTCRAGLCRAEAGAPLAASGASLVHAVDADTCESGLRWMGGDAPSAEMQPGSDCVGCHAESGARSLILGGTIYASATYEGPRPVAGCFGLEGVEVVIEDAEGREFRALTNRAGNFYVEGSPSDVALPYSAELRWALDGESIRTSMGTTPQYGGCARCHGSERDPPERFDLTPASSDYVNPVAPIFTPGLVGAR